MGNRVVRGRKARAVQSVRGTGKARDFRRVVLCSVEYVDEAQDVCMTYMPSWQYPEAFRARVRVRVSESGFYPADCQSAVTWLRRAA